MFCHLKSLRNILGIIVWCGPFLAGGAPWLFASPAGSRVADVEVQIEPQRAMISNGYLSLEYSLAHGRARTALIRNLRASKTFRAHGEDFVLEFADGRRVKSSDIRLQRARMEASGPDGRRLVLELSLDDLRLRLITEMRAAQWWATRWLEITAGTGRLTGTSLAHWRATNAVGPSGAGNLMQTLGYPSGCGQVVYAEDLFFAIAHPGAENFAAGSLISCRIPAWEELGHGKPVVTRRMVIGAGEPGAARRAFLKYIDATRAVPSRMIFLVNDWYWKDKSRPLEAFRALARLKKETGVPIDSFTLDDGWDFDWDDASGIWGRLNRSRFPGGWEALEAIAKPSEIGISLWFGPIGGYSFRPKRIEFARKAGYEVNGDKLCLAGPRYRAHVIESFSRWAALGMDYIKVDGFWPDCQNADHGHPVGPGSAIAQMDSLAEVFASWRKARPGLVIGYTSGSNPSPFWLQHADFVWRGGRDDSHAGAGEPFDQNNTFLDRCLQAQRTTEMPMSAFVTFDIVQGRIAGNSDVAFQRGIWWLAARTSLHHDWYVQSSDLTDGQWKHLAQAARWAKSHEKLFRWSRMVGGDPAKEEVYGFSAFDEGRGVLALRNPGNALRAFESTLASLVELPQSARSRPLRLRGVYGETRPLEGDRLAEAPFRLELPPLAIAVLELESAGRQ